MAKKVINCINPNLYNIYKKSSQIIALSSKITPHLPEELKSYCKASNFTNGKLILSVPSQVIATKLRFELPNIRDKLRNKAGLFNLRSIEIKVITDTANKETKPIKNNDIKPSPWQELLSNLKA